jgi:hypothetical protein
MGKPQDQNNLSGLTHPGTRSNNTVLSIEVIEKLGARYRHDIKLD